MCLAPLVYRFNSGFLVGFGRECLFWEILTAIIGYPYSFLTDFPCELCGRSPLGFCNEFLIDSKYSGLFYFFINSFRNSSFVSPACCMIARRVPFLMVLWCGTVILCLPSVRYMWLPFWWTILNPALLRVFRILRHDRDGSFLDSYFHQLSFSFKLV